MDECGELSESGQHCLCRHTLSHRHSHRFFLGFKSVKDDLFSPRNIQTSASSKETGEKESLRSVLYLFTSCDGPGQCLLRVVLVHIVVVWETKFKNAQFSLIEVVNH